jgi:hypothetical protein
MSKFDDYFSEVQHFSNGVRVISGKMDRELAAEMMTKELMEFGDISEPLKAEDLDADRVRFGFAPDFVEDCQGQLCWYTGASGKGSLPVWVYG